MKKFDKLYNDIIVESSLSKIYFYIKNFECATISASRNKIINVTENTLIPEGYKDGDFLTKEQNKNRNSMLKAKLLHLGYGVTALDGRYAEEGEMFPGKETSYFVVNRNNDKNFYKNLFKLSELFNQDSFLYKPSGTINAKLIGTNLAERNESQGQPGFGQEIDVGEFHPNGFENALSKIGNKVFQFRLNEHKEQNHKFFADNILCEEIFENLSNISKAAIHNTAKKVKL